MIQARMVPGSAGVFCSNVSVNTAIALAVGSQRVVFGLYAMRVDGEEIELEIGERLPLGGGEILRMSSEDFVVILGEDEHDYVWRRSGIGNVLNIGVELKGSRAGQVRGLLGNFNGDPDNEMVSRDGVVLVEPVAWSELYEVFGDSYRVTDETSLFDYAEGEDTSTYRIPDFPGEPALVEFLDPAIRDPAQIVCEEAGLLDPVMLDACILDVACSGNHGYAEDLARVDAPLRSLNVSYALLFADWVEQGADENGVWSVSEDGRSVEQTENRDPTFFVGPDDHLDVIFNGKFRVEARDNDFIGFVFGYQSPLAQNGDSLEDMNYFLFDWKQAQQSEEGFTGEEGFSLSRVSGEFSDYIPQFWGHQEVEGFDLLASDYGAGRGWRRSIEYSFELRYGADHIVIHIDGEEVFAITAQDAGLESFPPGRFGFYNYSQPAVHYYDFVVRYP